MSNQQAIVLSVNISKKKGTVKVPVEEINVTLEGIENDAHAGKWQRQLSLLTEKSIIRFEKINKRKIVYGEFAENITLSGIDLMTTHPLDQIYIGDVQLEITQLGKKCHGKNCSIYKETGDCVMPKEGIFARVMKAGKIKAGDIVYYHQKVYRILLITLSDRANQGIYEDLSGPEIRHILVKHFKETGRKVEIENHLIADDQQRLDIMIKLAIQKGFDVIITNGGTGLSPNDITIETVTPMLDKNIPGIMEYIRIKYGSENPAALISCSIAGVIGKSLVFCLPGSVKAVDEYMAEILKNLDHLIFTVNGLDIH